MKSLKGEKETTLSQGNPLNTDCVVENTAPRAGTSRLLEQCSRPIKTLDLGGHLGYRKREH